MQELTEPGDDEKMGLGLLLTVIQIVSYFSFISFCCFDRSFFHPATAQGSIPGILYWGLAVIGTGAVTTLVYVLSTNQKSAAVP